MKDELTQAELARLRANMPEDEVQMIAQAVEISGRQKLICPYLSQTEDLSENELIALEGQRIHRGSIYRIGEGTTRTAYRAAKFVVEPFMTQITPVTITVPKDADESNSVNYKISCARGDGDLAEHNASKEIGYHPNLVGSLGTINPGRRININEHFEGVDLEELVKTRGPIKDKTISREITRQILSGLSYMHERGYLHGDIKPSNVFVNTELDQIRDSYDTVKIADFQTAMKKTQVLESSLPPRGAAKYAHRSLLNATATGQPAKASERTDIYSFGATLCFMLTGKQPSNYRVIEDENGREHSIDEKRFRLSLYDGTQKLTEITAEKEEERIKDLVKNVPLSERMLVYRCMTDKEGERFETFEQIKAYLKNPVYAQTKYLGKRILQRFSSS